MAAASAEFLLGTEILNDISRYRGGEIKYSALRRKLDLCAAACGRVGSEWMGNYRKACTELIEGVRTMDIAEPPADLLEGHLRRVEILLQSLNPET